MYCKFVKLINFEIIQAQLGYVTFRLRTLNTLEVVHK